MKRISFLITGVAGLLLLALATPTFAADKEKTITGEAKCAKCSMHEAEKCQTVIQAEGKNGKMVNYYLADNEKAKAFHENVCKESKKVTATGTVKKVDGKNELTVTSIEVVK
jgi:RecG-like helicase